MEEKCFDTLEECRASTEEGGTVLLEKTIYSSKTGEIDIHYSLVKKCDEYNIFEYGKWRYVKSLDKYVWDCSHVSSIGSISAESLIVLLTKKFFKSEYKRIITENNKYL